MLFELAQKVSQELNSLDAEKADEIYVDATNLRIDNLVIPISPENANIEVTDSHNSIVKNKNFASLKARLEESESDLNILTTDLDKAEQDLVDVQLDIIPYF